MMENSDVFQMEASGFQVCQIWEQRPNPKDGLASRCPKRQILPERNVCFVFPLKEIYVFPVLKHLKQVEYHKVTHSLGNLESCIGN